MFDLTEKKTIAEVADRFGISIEDRIPYGRHFLKVDHVSGKPIRKDSKIVLVTAMTPTKAGEGKTTTAIALTDGLNLLFKGTGKKAAVALRQPSMGPVFGMKGGATGGGNASVVPVDDININFTGDIHALTAANSLISAVIDNSIFQGNPLNIDPERIVFPRCLDMNDRALRTIVAGIDKKHPQGHKESFVITAASELMAILCLAKDADDFRKMVENIICAYDFDGNPILVKDFNISGAIMKIMRDALLPNLAQTAYASPAFIHGGPFANIAHGCCSYQAIRGCLEYADYVITEAGFGSDLGGEKFLDILCQRSNLIPSAVVVVGSVRACKLQGGEAFENLAQENLQALKDGSANLIHHLKAMGNYGVNLVCCLNRFPTDTDKEIALLKESVAQAGYKAVVCSGYMDGPTGSLDLAKAVVEAAATPSQGYHAIVKAGGDVKETILTIAQRIYGAKDVVYTTKAEEDLATIQKLDLTGLYVCMAKTPLSLTDDPKIQGEPKDFTIEISSIRLSAGSRFVVPVLGKTLLMPGLPKVPAAVGMKE